MPNKKNPRRNLSEDSQDIDSTIVKLASAGRVDEAKSRLNASLGRRILPGPRAWGSLINAYAERGLPKKAQLIFDQMRSEGQPPERQQWAALVKAYGLAGDVDGATRIFDEMLRSSVKGVDVKEWGTLTNIYAIAADPNKLEYAIARMMESGIRPNKYHWNHLLQAYLNSEDLQGLKDAFKRLRHQFVTPEPVHFLTIVMGYARLSGAEMGEEVFRQMLLEGFSPTKQLFGEVLNAYATKGDIKNSERIFNEQIEAGIQPDEYQWTSLFNAYAQAGNSAGLERRFQDLVESRSIPVTQAHYGCLINSYAFSGDLSGAMKTFRKMQREGITATRYQFGSLMKAAIRTRKYDRVKALYDEMISVGIETSEIEFGILLEAFAKLGDPSSIRSQFDLAKKIELPINQHHWSSLIKAYLKSNQREKAVGVLTEMDQNGVQPDPINAVILASTLYDLGRRDEARLLIDGLSSTTSSKDWFLLVFGLSLDLKMAADGQIDPAGLIQGVKERMDLTDADWRLACKRLIAVNLHLDQGTPMKNVTERLSDPAIFDGGLPPQQLFGILLKQNPPPWFSFLVGFSEYVLSSSAKRLKEFAEELAIPEDLEERLKLARLIR